MAARYVRIGQHPDYRDEIRGTLSEILASTANPGTYAAPEDVTGTYLEMGADGLWTGATLGALTQVQADALVALGAMGKVQPGTRATVGTSEVVWRGGAWLLAKKTQNTFAHANRAISVYGGSSAVVADRTVPMQICADGEFGGFRIRFHNTGNSALTVGPVVAAVAADSGATGTALTWVPVLFGGQSTVTIPASPSYASGGDVEFSVADSDYVFLASVARADGSKYPILQVRSYYQNGGTCDTGSGSDTLAMTNAAFPAGKRIMSARSAGNTATYPTALGMTLSDSAVTYSIAPAEVEFTYTAPIVSVAGFGDSISNGIGDAATPLVSPLAKAVITLNGSDAPRYSWAQFAQSAQSHAKTTNNCIATLATLRPSIVRIPTFSPNDGTPTAALMQRFFANTMRMVEAATKAGSAYYLVGPPPCWNGAHEAIILAYIAKITAWCTANGVAYLDSRAILQDPANPGKYLPAYNSGDNVHPSAAGRGALAAGDAVIISALA